MKYRRRYALVALFPELYGAKSMDVMRPCESKVLDTGTEISDMLYQKSLYPYRSMSIVEYEVPE